MSPGTVTLHFLRDALISSFQYIGWRCNNYSIPVNCFWDFSGHFRVPFSCSTKLSSLFEIFFVGSLANPGQGHPMKQSKHPHSQLSPSIWKSALRQPEEFSCLSVQQVAGTPQSPRNLPVSHSVPRLRPFPSHYPKHPPFGLLPARARLPALSLAGTLETALLSPRSTRQRAVLRACWGLTFPNFR